MNYFGQFPQYGQPYSAPTAEQLRNPYMQTQQNGLIWVRNQMEAEQYMMAPNSAVTLWDMSTPAVYLKKTDASGRPEFEAYDLVKRSAASQQVNTPVGEFVTRQEFEEFARRMASVLKEKEEAE